MGLLGQTSTTQAWGVQTSSARAAPGSAVDQGWLFSWQLGTSSALQPSWAWGRAERECTPKNWQGRCIPGFPISSAQEAEDEASLFPFLRRCLLFLPLSLLPAVLLSLPSFMGLA